MTECPECKGSGTINAFACPGFFPVSMKCQLCQGAGEISEEQAGWAKIGEELRQDRIRRGNTLRVEALDRKMKPVELSEMESGIRKPERRV